MNRKEFLKRLGLIGAATTVAPKIMEGDAPEIRERFLETERGKRKYHQVRVTNKNGVEYWLATT